MTQDIILETTMEFIRRNENNLNLALRVEKAMPQLRRELCRQVLEATKEMLEAQKQNNAVPVDWNICSSYENDKKDLMTNYSYLAFRREDWSRETPYNSYTSGAQLVTDRSEWGSVWFGVCFPRNYEQQNDEVMQNILQTFSNEGGEEMWRRYHLYGGDKYQMWRQYRFPNWRQKNFMITAINNPDGIVEELADGLINLTKLVESHLAAARIHHDG